MILLGNGELPSHVHVVAETPNNFTWTCHGPMVHGRPCVEPMCAHAACTVLLASFGYDHELTVEGAVPLSPLAYDFSGRGWC